ncbi:efflux RND transporter periplasmic adaptor subunit [Roseobacter sp. YSTF-M11]|uniref:Efflux RND transporter periplasmic adaptor subunit n=1 Tax=Roseobacter insulae TaxID=2859783 RepID=A0A9X1FU79_9RHOB|nr:efflux RND transporter periplasmic adaptor subunit [Roseobacter insulae]MBW4707737.1 efflux RND transporter periplasmic adaptor subunit [Roseobacter insulae]
MRFFSIIAAILVSAVLALFILDRPRLTALLGRDNPEAEDRSETTEISADTQGGAELVKVVVQKSVARQIDTAVILRGETKAAREVDVRAETSAVVVSEPLRKGARVETGQALCRLDEGTRGTALALAQAQLDEARARVPEAEARLDQALAQLDEALINQNASAKLSQGGFASTTRVANSEAAVATAQAGVESARAGLQASQSGIQSAQANVATARKEIERLTITAPFSGLLESDTAELGALLQPGDLCATIIQLDPIKLVAYVPETEVARVTEGATAVARLVSGIGAINTNAPANRGQDVRGQVTFLSRSADETTRTFRVEIEVPNSNNNIRDGQTAEIQISAEGATAHLLPQSALTLNDEGTLGVRTIDDNAIVEFHPVTLMRDTVEGIWITGLDQTANVIVLGQEYVVAGVQVAPTYKELSQ